MKIIQLIYSLSSGGGERFVVDLSNQLTLMGNDVVLCMLLRPDEKLCFNRQFLNSKVKFHSMGFEQGFSLRKISPLEKYILDEQPDVVHCHLNVIPYIFKLALKYRNIAFIHTLHNLAENTCTNPIQKVINRFFYKREFIYPVCISKFCQQSYNNFYRLYNAPFINNGRAEILPSKLMPYVKQEIASYMLTQRTKIFVHVARFHYQKNQKLLVDAFNKLFFAREDVILLVIGKDFDSIEGFKLQKSACRNIIFLGEKNNVPDYLFCADAFCLSSFYEGMPITVLEALCCGATPICTSVGGIKDIVKDGYNGYLSEDFSIESYVNAIKRFIEKPIPRNSLHNFFVNNFTMSVCANKYEKLYNSILHK